MPNSTDRRTEVRICGSNETIFSVSVTSYETKLVVDGSITTMARHSAGHMHNFRRLFDRLHRPQFHPSLDPCHKLLVKIDPVNDLVERLGRLVSYFDLRWVHTL